MRVFKLFLKIEKSYRKTIIPYITIFLVIFVSLALSVSGQDPQLELAQPKITIFDHDQTELTRHFTEYLLEQNEYYEIEEDEEIIREAIFEDRLNYAISIPKGFTETFNQGGQYADLNIYASYSDRVNKIIDTQIETYLRFYDSFRLAYGGSIAEADVEKTLNEVDEIIATEVEGNLLTSDDNIFAMQTSTYFRFLNYIIIVLSFQAVGRGVTVIEEPNLKRRDLVSGYSERKRTRGLFAAVFIVMLIIWLIMTILLFAVVGFSAWKETTVPWMVLSNFIHLLSLASFVLLLTHIFPKEEAASFMGTLIGLTTAFATGIFIPREIIWRPLQMAFSFMPTYWDVSNQLLLEHTSSLTSDLPTLGRNIGIMLLMGAVFFTLTLVLRRAREKEAA